VPETGLEAKFSMPYTIARSVLDDSIGFDTFTDSLVQDERTRDLTRRVKMYIHEGIESRWKLGSRPVLVRIRFRDGSVRERQVDISKGNPEVPLTPEELGKKFTDCARVCLQPQSIKAAIEGLENIEVLGAISELTARLRGNPVLAP
jgi:2-methylcitrate dehydratase PrpD